MAQFKLDYTNTQILQISNDAFFYLAYGEDPIDDDNIEEANEIVVMFPNGFYIEEDWKYVEDSDLIEATFVPYIEDDADFDEYENLTKYCQHQIKWIDANTIRLWWYNALTNERKLEGDFKVFTNQYGLKYFHTGDQNKPFELGKMSMYFLKHFHKKSA